MERVFPRGGVSRVGSRHGSMRGGDGAFGVRTGLGGIRFGSPPSRQGFELQKRTLWSGS